MYSWGMDRQRRSVQVSDGRHAGIDLGTTFSAIAIVDDAGAPVAIRNAEDEMTTPSVVHVRADGTFLVGRPAQEQPLNTQMVFKRFMGTPRLFPLRGRDYSPEELSAEVLRKLVGDAERRLGAPIREVVITVPAHFGQTEREATRRAGELAGLTVLQMINEPTAAATAYAQSHPLDQGHSLIFDLGGGTLDITLLEVTPSGPYVKRTSGSLHLGGQDFTDKLVERVDNAYQAAHGVGMTGEARLRLNAQCEAAKIALTTAPQVQILASPPDGAPMHMTVTRDEFEEEIDAYIMQMQVMLESLLDRADLTPSDIKQVLLVGGSSRIPAVRSMLREYFGREPTATLDADLGVAWGAALVAASIQRDATGLVMEPAGLVIADSVSHAIGVKAFDQFRQRQVLDVVLPHGFPLGKWSTDRQYRPERANEALLAVDLYQGDTADLDNCIPVGRVNVPLPAGATPDNTLVRVRMRLNQSGLLEMQVAVNNEPHRSAEFRL